MPKKFHPKIRRKIICRLFTTKPATGARNSTDAPLAAGRSGRRRSDMQQRGHYVSRAAAGNRRRESPQRIAAGNRRREPPQGITAENRRRELPQGIASRQLIPENDEPLRIEHPLKKHASRTERPALHRRSAYPARSRRPIASRRYSRRSRSAIGRSRAKRPGPARNSSTKTVR